MKAQISLHTRAVYDQGLLFVDKIQENPKVGGGGGGGGGAGVRKQETTARSD